MKRIALIGGGRWGRVHLTVLQSLLGVEDEVIWLTSHGAEGNETFLHSKGIANTRVVMTESALWDAAPTAAIIATRTPTHAAWLEKCLTRGIPALAEKPATLSVAEAERLIALARSKNVPAGMNLEFTYASYLETLAATARDLDFQTVEITWHDPSGETRHGETKQADASTPHMWDAIPHCWSLLRALLPGVTYRLVAVTPSGNRVLVNLLSSDHHAISLSLSRSAGSRQRLITVNNAVTLNFNPEPGTLTVGTHTRQLEWGALRPMGAALASFLRQLENPSPAWPLSLANTLPALALAEDAQLRLDRHAA